MRILVLNYEYPPVGGGGGAVAHQVAHELVKRGHQVGVQTTGCGTLAKIERVDGVHICRHFAFRRRRDRCSVPEMVLFVLCGLWPTWRRIRRQRPDLMHVHFAVPTGILAWALHKLTGVPYVLTAHLGDVPGGVPAQTDRWFGWIKPLTRRIWRDAAGATAVSDFVRDLAESSYQIPVRTLRNGVVLPAESSLKLAVGDPPRLIFAGRFHPQKNLLFLVRILKKLDQYPWRCQLLGDGPEMAAVREAVQKAGLCDRIHMPGWQDQAVVDEALAGSDILFMPSHSEGMPVVAAKALAFGLAVVGSDIGGLQDMIEHEKNGLLLDKEHATGFAEALGILLVDRARLAQMKRNSRHLAHRFDLTKIIDGYEDVFAAIEMPDRKVPRQQTSDQDRDVRQK